MNAAYLDSSGWVPRELLRTGASAACREHRAALSIQTAWRRHQAQKDFQQYRHGVVTAQGLWRVRVARRRLRALRMEAREAGKLMQDKRFLEHKVAELAATLELVQNQRNDIRQQFKVLRTHFLGPAGGGGDVVAFSPLRSGGPTRLCTQLSWSSLL